MVDLKVDLKGSLKVPSKPNHSIKNTSKKALVTYNIYQDTGHVTRTLKAWKLNLVVPYPQWSIGQKIRHLPL